MSPRLDAADVGPPSLPWRITLTVSMTVHVLGFILAVGLPRLLPRPALRPVYVVDLVALPGGPATDSPPPPAAAAPQPAAPPAPKKSEKAITIPEPKKPKAEPKKTPVPKKTPEPKPTSAPAASSNAPASGKATSPSQAPPTDKPATAAQDGGVPGGTGAVTGGYGGTGTAAADAMTFYASLVRRNIENAWKKPIYPPTETGRRIFTIQIRLTLTSSGRVADVKVLVPSGYEAMDRSVLAAVNEAMFPPFPSTLTYSSLPFPVEIALTPD
jgi:TonB family protein